MELMSNSLFENTLLFVNSREPSSDGEPGWLAGIHEYADQLKLAYSVDIICIRVGVGRFICAARSNKLCCADFPSKEAEILEFIYQKFADHQRMISPS